MTKLTYNELKALIIKEHGNPDWELNQPRNESARRLAELKNKYLDERREERKTKELVKDVHNLLIPNDTLPMPFPDELIKDSWLTPFSKEGKQVVRQWALDITQRPAAIQAATNLPMPLVRSTISSEAFKLLRGHLALAYKNILPLEASSALRRCLHSKDDKIALQALKLVLIDAGLYKGETSEVTHHQSQSVTLDPATEKRLRELGNQLLNDSEHGKSED